jgi:hypothetical protein
MHRLNFARFDDAAVRWPLTPHSRFAVTLSAAFAFAVALSSCGESQSDCDSFETRNSVIRIAADDDHAALVNYAIKNSSSVAETVNNSASEKARSANLARVEAVNDESAKINDRIAEIKKEYQAKFRSWEEDNEKRGKRPTTDERNSMLGRMEQQSNDAISQYTARLNALQEERGRLHNEYPKLDATAEAEKSVIWGTARRGAVFTLDDTIFTNSRNSATREFTCSGLLYVKVGNTTAQKEVDFKVQPGPDGKTSVSVNRFMF